MPEKGLLGTTTGERFQPVRLHYRVRDRKGLLKAFEKLRCVQRDPAKPRWVWLYDFEARDLPLPKPYAELSPQLHPIVIGSFYAKGEERVVLDVRSCERALLAVPFFDRHVPRRVAKVTELEVVTRLFTEEEKDILPEQLFDRQETVALDPEAELRALAEQAAKAADARERLRIASDFMDALTRRPLPEVERLPVHYYEDGLTSLELALNVRQIVAMQHWLGNTAYSIGDAVEEIMRTLPEA